MYTIRESFDTSKDLNKRIESVVTFADNSEENLKNEINEYVVTEKLHNNYEKVIDELECAFRDSSNEVGVWVSGFYGSGKSSFAKYLGYSFQKSLMVDGLSFGEKLMNRIGDSTLKTLHRTIIQKYNPLVILIDLTTEATAGKMDSTVSDIIYYETLKQLGIKVTDPKLMYFISLLQDEGKYDEFCKLVSESGKNWETIQTNGLIANKTAAKFAPIVLPDYFDSPEEYSSINVETRESEVDRFKRLINLVKHKLGNDKIVYVLDEVGQYVASSDELITSMQGTMQILKSQFKGNVWLIATAQQTLTEDNPMAQINSNKLFKLNDRFPIKVDIEADDIKEIITKRLLGKSPSGKQYLIDLFNKNEGSIKLETRYTRMERSLYLKPLVAEQFADLYPFLPVHIDMLLALLQKLASRSGGSGLRSIIRLIRDLLVDFKLADQPIGMMATPDLFYDVLHPYMEKSDNFREIVISAKKAMEIFSTKPMAVKACKTIAIMQLLDDFCLNFENLCSLLFTQINHPIDKVELRDLMNQIKETPGVTLQEIDGKFRFMTNAILSIQDERAKINPYENDKVNILKDSVKDILSPAPSVSIFGSKTINASVELVRNRKINQLIPGGDIKLNVRFVDNADFDKEHTMLLTESTKSENKQTLYWICTLPQDIELLLIDIVKDETINNRHLHDANKEIQDYLRAQKADAEAKRSLVIKILRLAQNNSETICKGSPNSVNGETYKTQSFKSFAEQVYNKYELAARNMSGNVVETLFSYDESTSLPASLNPFNIVGEDGTINTNYPAFADIKDYISANADTNGNQLLEEFSRAPYGWSKDTIRYLVALMLKAGMLVVRSGAQSFKMLTKNSSEAMKNNTLFSKLGFSLNTDATLSPLEVMEAMKVLKELFNPQGLTPVLPNIVKASLKVANLNKAKYEQLKETFHVLNMAGYDRVARAANYLDTIIEHEGQDAPYLFAKDKACADSFRYVNNVMKQDKQGKLLSSIKHIVKKLDDFGKIQKLDQLKELERQVSDTEQAFNDLMTDPDCFNHTAEYSDLCSQLDQNIEQACIHFHSEALRIITEKIDDIKASEVFQSLKDTQKQEIETILGKISIQEGSTLEQLQDMCNQFSAVFVPGSSFSKVERMIKEFVQENKPAVTQPEEPIPGTENPATPQEEAPATQPAAGGGGYPTQSDESGEEAHEPETKVVKRAVKRRLTKREDVQAVIDDLTSLLPQIDEGSSIELSLND
ncbi:MAG: BREX system P-loop protein BrxC [Massilibacteroides sp.]|nr:BREX system P-loop protein BrxC [Massilibacteroides sp.]